MSVFILLYSLIGIERDGRKKKEKKKKKKKEKY